MQRHSDFIIVEPKAGLCNRLRVVFSWLEYSRSQNKSLVVIWPPTKECPGLFEDYFECPEHCRFITDKIDDREITYRGCLQHEAVTDNYIYQKLKLTTNMQQIILDQINIYGNYNSMHIRRTDFDNHLKKYNFPYTEDYIFEQFIDQSDKKVYLATDNVDSQNKYKTLFPDKIIIRPEIFAGDISTFRQTSLKEAIIDMYICIYSCSFLGTTQSSFSTLINAMRQLHNM